MLFIKFKTHFLQCHFNHFYFSLDIVNVEKDQLSVKLAQTEEQLQDEIQRRLDVRRMALLIYDCVN